MLQSVNIQLPDEIFHLLDELSSKGDRSSIVTAAIQHYVQFLQKENLREEVKLGAIERSDRDRQLTEDWFTLEEEIRQDQVACIR
jgi:CopG family transcriptional regulator / antitoxin EndoAI